jgi:Ulp1 family protease
MNEKIIYNMDSLNTKDGVLERMYSVLCWLFDSMIEEEGEFLHVDQWYFQTKAIFDQQQENGVDCGFYVLHYMKFIIEGKGLKSLTDLHMVEFRKFVGLALLKKSIWWERNKEKYGVADNDV